MVDSELFHAGLVRVMKCLPTAFPLSLEVALPDALSSGGLAMPQSQLVCEDGTAIWSRRPRIAC